MYIGLILVIFTLVALNYLTPVHIILTSFFLHSFNHYTSVHVTIMHIDAKL